MSQKSPPAELPFVRPPFPCSIESGSPVLGANPDTLLRICFRIGEAINAASLASQKQQNLLIELYARVTITRSDGTSKKVFQLWDLYHDRPPYLEGWYDTHGNEFDGISTIIANNGVRKLCRCVGNLRKYDQKWRLQLLKFHETNWAAIETARDLICS